MPHFAELDSDTVGYPTSSSFRGARELPNPMLTDVADLSLRAVQVGYQIGWVLNIAIWDEFDFIALTACNAGTDETAISGPRFITERAVEDIISTLNDLESGSRQLIVDEQGDPRLVP